MKRLAAALLLCSCATAPDAPKVEAEGPIVELRRSFRCPLPLSRGLVTIKRDGSAERTVFEGPVEDSAPPKSTRETMSIPARDAAALFNKVADSDWKTMPDAATPRFGPPGEHVCADCCSGALMVKTQEGGRSLAFEGAEKPPAKLEALLKAFEDALSKGRWERAYYPWEKKP